MRRRHLPVSARGSNGGGDGGLKGRDTRQEGQEAEIEADVGEEKRPEGSRRTMMTDARRGADRDRCGSAIT